VHVELPDGYPYKSPSIGFCNRLFHPNVDEMSGSVCLDVINQTWSPMFDLLNVFEVFLPQLLLYPNAADPLNGEAAALLLREPEQYKAKIREYVAKYGQAAATAGSDDSDSEGGGESGEESSNGARPQKRKTDSCLPTGVRDDTCPAVLDRIPRVFLGSIWRGTPTPLGVFVWPSQPEMLGRASARLRQLFPHSRLEVPRQPWVEESLIYA